MFWGEAHQQAMIAAAQAHEEAAVDTFHHVDVFAAMADAGLKVLFRPLRGCAALYLPSIRGSRPGAVVHAGHPLALQRFSAAHEFGHHVFGDGPQVVPGGEPRPRGASVPPHEMLAEAFAAWFLMPPEAAELALERLGHAAVERPEQAYELALRLGTSYRATCIHLESLNQLGRSVATAWAEMPLKRIKEGLTSTAPPGGWRNDVWLVRSQEANGDVPLNVRAGDRLLFALPGAWEVEELPAGASCSIEAASDLLKLGCHPRASVDLPLSTPPGPAAMTLATTGKRLCFGLVVERPRHGLYVPAQGAPR